MRRRQVLKLGAALTLFPLAGCASTAAKPEMTPGAKAPVDVPPAPPPPVPPPTSSAPDPLPRAAAPPDVEPAAPDVPAEPPGASFSRVVARLGKNHGHAITIPLADVVSAEPKTYDIRGTSKHTHSVTLLPEHCGPLLAGESVRLESTNELHRHRVLVRCAPPVDPPEWVSVCKFSSSGKDEHEIVITAADMQAKVEKTYDVQGLAGHPHQVTLTAADFEKLAAGGPVTHHTTRDATDGHLHTVTIEYRKPKG